MKIFKDERGFGLLAALVLLVSLGTFGAASVSLLSTDQEGRALEWSKRQAFYVNQAGLEYAQLVNSQGGDPTVTDKSFGPGTFTITKSGNQVNVSSKVGSAKHNYAMTVEPPPSPPVPPPDVDNGVVTVEPNYQVEVAALCTQIQSGGKTVPVTAGIKINGSYQMMYGGQVIPPNGGVTFITDSGPAGSTYITKGIATISKSNVKYYWSTNTVQVKTLVNGDTPPNVPGFNGQIPITECVASYVDEQGKIKLQPNQVIYLFELGMNAQIYPTHPATDFQDLVLLMTVGEP